MCTIAILLDVTAGAPLVVAANRDEIYARPARPPESLGARIAGGVDALAGGTWLAGPALARAALARPRGPRADRRRGSGWLRRRARPDAVREHEPGMGRRAR